MGLQKEMFQMNFDGIESHAVVVIVMMTLDTIFNNCCARKILYFALLDFATILVKERLLTIPILNMGQLNLGED